MCFQHGCIRHVAAGRAGHFLMRGEDALFNGRQGAVFGGHFGVERGQPKTAIDVASVLGPVERLPEPGIPAHADQLGEGGKARVIDQREILAKIGEEAVRIGVSGRRRDDPSARRCPGDDDRHIGRAVIALENQGDRRLLRGMELVDDVAGTPFGVLHPFQARRRAVQGEVQRFEDRAFSDPVGRMDGIDGIVLELQHERIAVIIDAAGPSGRPSSAARTARLNS